MRQQVPSRQHFRRGNALRTTMFRPPTTDSRHGFAVWPNLAWKLRPTAVNLLWVADISVPQQAA